MKTEYHAFVDGDAGRCGAILRHVEPRRMRTRTVFRMGEDAPLYLVDHVVEHDGDVRRWTRFEYDSPSSGRRHSGTRAPDGTVHVDGTWAPQLFDAVGAYGEHLVLAQMLGADEEAVSYLQFDEGDAGEGALARSCTGAGRRHGPARRLHRGRRAHPAAGADAHQRALVR